METETTEFVPRSVRLARPLYEQIKTLAKSRGVSASELIREGLVSVQRNAAEESRLTALEQRLTALIDSRLAGGPGAAAEGDGQRVAPADLEKLHRIAELALFAVDDLAAATLEDDAGARERVLRQAAARRRTRQARMNQTGQTNSNNGE